MYLQLAERRFAAISKRYDDIESRIQKLQELVVARVSPACSEGTKGALNTPHTPGDALEARSGEAHVDPSTIASLQPCEQDDPRVAELRRWCLDNKLYSAIFKWVPSDYYSHNLMWRRDMLDAPTIFYLCKTIVLTNTHCVNSDCSIRENSRYYMLVFQYVDRFDTDLVMRFIRELNPTLGKKKFNFKLASPKESFELTGFPSGAVVPFGTRQQIPVILSAKIAKLEPRFFWVGGGHTVCKARVDIDEYLKVLNPLVANVTQPLSPEELESIID